VTTRPIASGQETVLALCLAGAQSISANVTVGGLETRGVSATTTINYSLSLTALPGTHLGWYVDASRQMEKKQVTESVLRSGRIIFTTLIPSTDPCSPGGTGWLMELNTRKWRTNSRYI